MTQEHLQKILMKCFYGDIDDKEAFKLINEDREKLLREIADLTKDANHLAMCIDTFHADEETYKIMGKYVAHLPKTYKKDIPWPDPLDRSEIKDSKEKCDQKFKDGIRYFQG
jgi:hypothetical protein